MDEPPRGAHPLRPIGATCLQVSPYFAAPGWDCNQLRYVLSRSPPPCDLPTNWLT